MVRLDLRELRRELLDFRLPQESTVLTDGESATDRLVLLELRLLIAVSTLLVDGDSRVRPTTARVDLRALRRFLVICELSASSIVDCNGVLIVAFSSSEGALKNLEAEAGFPLSLEVSIFVLDAEVVAVGVFSILLTDVKVDLILEDDNRLALRVLRRRGVSSAGALRFLGVEDIPIFPNGSLTLDLDDAEVDADAGVPSSTVSLLLSTVMLPAVGEFVCTMLATDFSV